MDLVIPEPARPQYPALVSWRWLAPFALVAVVAYLGSLGLVLSSPSTAGTLQPLVLLPIMWAALCHSRRVSSVVVLAAAAMLGVTSGLAGAAADVVVFRMALWGTAGEIVVLGAWNLRSRLAGAIAERDEALRQARVLSDAARELNSTLDPAQVIGIAVRLAAEVASPPGSRARRANYCRIADGMVHLTAEFDGEGEWVGASWPLSEHPHLERAARARAPTLGTLDPDELGPAVREVNRSQGVGHGGWVPVVVDAELHGVLAVAGRNRPVSEHELARCVSIVQIMELALRNALAHERLHRAALTDPLTSLANRRGMESLIDERRRDGTLSVLAVDVDDLKQVNDRHGHAAGDELIVTVSDALRSVARANDIIARVGGDEFICILFDADERVGGHVAARLLAAIADVRSLDVIPAASIGVAAAPPGVSLDSALQLADAAMYAAKRSGGRRYQLASDLQATILHANTGAAEPSWDRAAVR